MAHLRAAAAALTLILAAAPPAFADDVARQDPAARALIERTLSAMGVGRDVRQLHTVRTVVKSVTYDLLENDHIGAPYPLAGFATTETVHDLQRGIEMQFNTAAPSASPTVLTRGAQRPGNPALPALEPPPSWETHDALAALLLARAAPDLHSEPDEVLHDIAQHVISFHNGRFPVKLYIGVELGLPSATEAVVDYREAVAWNGWGDMRERTEFSNYGLEDGLRYPQQTDIFMNGAHYRSQMNTSLRLDAEQDTTRLAALPPIPAAAPQPLNDAKLGVPLKYGPNPHRSVEELAPGIVQFPGSWYTTLVRQDDGVVVIDAPISSGYSRQVLAEAARRFPGLPVKAVITSTGFYWHIAGIREYIAHGIPIYVRSRIAPQLQALAAAPHTLSPDLQAQHPMAPVIREIEKPATIGHGPNAVTVIPIRYGEQPMLMTWVPGAKLLHTGEMIQPLGPNGSLLFPEALLEVTWSVAEAGVPTDGLRIIGMHASPLPWGAVGSALRDAGVAKIPASPFGALAHE